jgi:hypothetical protein
MATSQTCCHLPGEMLNSAAECADRARINITKKYYHAVTQLLSNYSGTDGWLRSIILFESRSSFDVRKYFKPQVLYGMQKRLMLTILYRPFFPIFAATPLNCRCHLQTRNKFPTLAENIPHQTLLV